MCSTGLRTRPTDAPFNFEIGINVTSNRATVAGYLRTQLATCGKTQLAISEEMGYASPNIITMFKQGRTKLPLGSAGRLARALGTDPGHLLRLALSEYEPSLLEAIEGLLARETLLTVDERAVVETVRAAAATRALCLDEPWAAKIIQGAIELIAETAEKRGQAAMEANDRLPPNMRNR